MGERKVVKVSQLQVEAARLAIKLANKFGWEPNPLMVRIANAKPPRNREAEESEPAAEDQRD